MNLSSKKIGFSAPFGDWCANKQVWRGYIDSINLDWLSSIIDITPLQVHGNLADSRDKWSMQNLNVVFSVAQLQLMNDIFIDSESFVQSKLEESNSRNTVGPIKNEIKPSYPLPRHRGRLWRLIKKSFETISHIDPNEVTLKYGASAPALHRKDMKKLCKR